MLIIYRITIFTSIIDRIPKKFTITTLHICRRHFSKLFIIYLYKEEYKANSQAVERNIIKFFF